MYKGGGGIVHFTKSSMCFTNNHHNYFKKGKSVVYQINSFQNGSVVDLLPVLYKGLSPRLNIGKQ